MTKLIQKDPLIIGIKGAKIDVSVHGVRPEFSSEEIINRHKDKLTPFYTPERIAETTKITNSMDVYRGVLYKVRELGAQFPSNAWSKFMEIYTSIAKIIGRDVIVKLPAGTSFTAFCNAELPGSSISALNHLFKTQYPNNQLSWIGSSYKPDNVGTQLGDEYGFFKNNRDRWLIAAPEFDGNMMVTETLRDCVSRYRAINPDGCHLYTHDAGLAVTEDDGPWKAYVDQERKNLKLHLGCSIVGLETLREGGSFVTKQYTLYEDNTKNLVKIYAEFFEEFYLVKPVTSRPYNSESYFVGLGFKRPQNADALLRRLYELHAVDDLLLTSKVPEEDKVIISISDITDDEYRTSGIMSFVDISAGRLIKFNDEIVTQLESGKRADTRLYNRVIAAWLTKTGIKPLSKNDWIPSN